MRRSASAAVGVTVVAVAAQTAATVARQGDPAVAERAGTGGTGRPGIVGAIAQAVPLIASESRPISSAGRCSTERDMVNTALSDGNRLSDGNCMKEGSYMRIFTEAALAHLQTARRLARLATVGPDGTPHVTPVGWSLNTTDQVIEVGGIDLAHTKKVRDVARTRRAAIVIDDVLPPWQPRGIEIRGRADAITDPAPRRRIYPERIIGWGLDGRHTARAIR